MRVVVVGGGASGYGSDSLAHMGIVLVLSATLMRRLRLIVASLFWMDRGRIWVFLKLLLLLC